MNSDHTFRIYEIYERSISCSLEENIKKTMIPKNMTIAEACEFWDEHSFFEFAGTKEVDVQFHLKKKHSVGIDRGMHKKLKEFARRQKTTPEALLESWIAEKIG